MKNAFTEQNDAGEWFACIEYLGNVCVGHGVTRNEAIAEAKEGLKEVCDIQDIEYPELELNLELE